MREVASPAFQFYAKEWIADTREFAPEIRAALIDLMAFSWVNGSVPDDPTTVATLVGVSLERITNAWPTLRSKFAADPNNPGRMVNRRLEVEREKQTEQRTQASVAGKLSAESRARKRVNDRFNDRSTTVATTVSTERQREANIASASASASAFKEKPADGGPAAASSLPKVRRPRPAKATSDELPGATVTRAAFIEAIASASNGRFIATPPPVGVVFKLDAPRALPDALAIATRIGEWLAAGGDAYRGVLDGRHLADLDAWIGQARAWDGRPIASRANGKPPEPSRPQPAVMRTPYVPVLD